MTGLLYKDFIYVNRINKFRFTWMLLGMTLLYIGLRMVFPGTLDTVDLLVEVDDGSTVNLLDVPFVMAFGLFLVSTAGLINSWVAKIVEIDEKGKIQSFLSATPLYRNTYIASKYVFIGIAAYVFLSLNYIWGITCMAFCRTGMLLNYAEILLSFTTSMIFIALLSAAIELPLFILMGKEKAMLIKVTIWMVIAFALIGFLFFGDLTWVSEHLDAAKLLSWFQTHQTEVFVSSAVIPVVILGLYYCSYRITCICAGREEKWN